LSRLVGAAGALLIAIISPAQAQLNHIFRDAPATSPPLQHESGAVGVYGTAWDGLDAEHKFATVIESFWEFARANGRAGSSFKTEFPEACRVIFTEALPMPPNVQRAWDGKITGNYQIAKSLDLSLPHARP
jgi:hypothetical protein